MLTRKRMLGLSIAGLAAIALFSGAATQASAADGRLTVTPAVRRVSGTSATGNRVQLVRYGYGRGGWGWGYRGYGGYGWRPYGYRPVYRPYIYRGYGYPAYGYGYPAYGYGYPGYYGYGPRVGVGVGVW